jgi:hypothetical protein
MGEELGLWRALNFTETSTPITNILGRQPKLRISDWNTDGKPAAYIVRRIVPWHDGLPSREQPKAFGVPTPGVGDPPKELRDRSSLKHSARRVASIINIPLWEKAKWGAVLYIWSSDPDEEPAIGLGFADGVAGKAIFRELREKLGPTDIENRLRVSIITGVDKANPSKYSVVIGSNLPAKEEQANPREIISVSRVHHMNNTDPANLKMFEARFSQSKRYAILPAQMPNKGIDGQVFGDLAIWKDSVRISPAWQIGENDIDSAAIGPKDDPIIPPDVVDAPILRLIDRRKRRPTR